MALLGPKPAQPRATLARCENLSAVGGRACVEDVRKLDDGLRAKRGVPNRGHVKRPRLALARYAFTFT